MTEKTRYEKLFDKLVDGVISPHELDTLLRYLDGAPDHDELRARIKQELARTEEHEQRELLHAIVDRVEGRLFNYLETPQRKVYLSWRWVAVAATFLAVVSVFWWVVVEQSEPQVISADIDIYPGGNKATLALADGRLIDLSDAQSGIVVNNGVRYNDGSEVLGSHTAPDGGDLPVEQLVLQTPKGGGYQVQLPDGTNVWLNAASSLTYPIRFSGERREVLLDGEAYFEVVNNTEFPFVVRSGAQELRVLGTSFNISAYSGDPQHITTLVSGAVSIKSTGREFVLKPSQQLRASVDGIEVFTVETADVTAWKNGQFAFYGETMPFIIRQIERWYDVSFENKELAEGIKLWGSLSREVMLSEILQVIEMNTTLKFTQQGRRIMIIQQ